MTAQVALLSPLAGALAELAGVGGDRPIEDRPEQLRLQGLGLWGQLHGVVSLEGNHHLDWMDDDERDALHVASVRTNLESVLATF